MSNFDKEKSQIKSVAPDGSEMTVQINIDVFSLKCFALLMCKGTNKTKANIFFDLVVGSEGVKQGVDMINWKSSRLVQGIKKLLFFSEIFPKKYQNEFIEELLKCQPSKHIKKNTNNADHNYAQDELESDSLKSGKSKEQIDKENQFFWSEEYLIYLEQNFDKIFKSFYEAEFVDQIFMEHESLINKDDFKTAIAGDLDEDAKCDWIFSPS